MKVDITETQYGFYIELNAETVPETAVLARMAMNAKRVPPSVNCSFCNGGEVYAWIALDARSEKRGEVSNT